MDWLWFLFNLFCDLADFGEVFGMLADFLERFVS